MQAPDHCKDVVLPTAPLHGEVNFASYSVSVMVRAGALSH